MGKYLYKDYIINNNNERIYLNYKVIIKGLKIYLDNEWQSIIGILLKITDNYIVLFDEIRNIKTILYLYLIKDIEYYKNNFK